MVLFCCVWKYNCHIPKNRVTIWEGVVPDITRKDFKMKNYRKQNKKNIYILVTLLWVCTIFSFSLQPGDESTALSGGIGKWLIENFLPIFGVHLEEMSAEKMELFHFLLRKCGHFSEYFILGILSILTLLQTKLRHRPVVGLGFCVVIASIDETIQLFVSGRAGQIPDVLLDSVGAAVGIGVLLVLRRLIKKFAGRKAF